MSTGMSGTGSGTATGFLHMCPREDDLTNRWPGGLVTTMTLVWQRFDSQSESYEHVLRTNHEDSGIHLSSISPCCISSVHWPNCKEPPSRSNCFLGNVAGASKISRMSEMGVLFLGWTESVLLGVVVENEAFSRRAEGEVPNGHDPEIDDRRLAFNRKNSQRRGNRGGGEAETRGKTAKGGEGSGKTRSEGEGG